MPRATLGERIRDWFIFGSVAVTLVLSAMTFFSTLPASPTPSVARTADAGEVAEGVGDAMHRLKDEVIDTVAPPVMAGGGGVPTCEDGQVWDEGRARCVLDLPTPTPVPPTPGPQPSPTPEPTPTPQPELSPTPEPTPTESPAAGDDARILKTSAEIESRYPNGEIAFRSTVDQHEIAAGADAIVETYLEQELSEANAECRNDNGDIIGQACRDRIDRAETELAEWRAKVKG